MTNGNSIDMRHLRIAVLAKQVPDTRNVGPEAMTAEGTVNRAALEAVYNPEDLNALGMALTIKEQLKNVEIVVVSMGPERAREVVREAIWRGADRGFVLSDRRFAGADTLATSYAISCAIKQIGEVDLVLAGRQAIDGDTAQTGPQVAEKLDMPQITYAEELMEISDKEIVVKRRIADGTETVKCQLPAVVTVTGSAPKCRYKHAHRMLQMRDPEIPILSADDVNPDFSRIGSAGSPTKVKKIENVVLTQKESVKVEPSQEALNALMSELVAKHIIG